MIPALLFPLANHLWQSTIIVALAGLLAFALRNNRASLRYGIWMGASIKFLIPFSLFIGVGSQLRWHSSQVAEPYALPAVVTQVSQPFSEPVAMRLLRDVPPEPSRIPATLFTLWISGFMVSVFLWFRSWYRIREAVNAASPLLMDLPNHVRTSVRVLGSAGFVEPSVFGLYRPVLLLPIALLHRLTPGQLQAVIVHELAHVKRRDNLTAAVHLLVEAIFWFYPLLWWVRKRLIDERERACDEEVLRVIAEPQDYAQGILTVCRFCMESSAICAPGVTGSDLRRRIENIMAPRMVRNMNVTKKVVLAAGGIVAVGLPFVVGVLDARQEPTSQLQFEVASIKPSPYKNNGAVGTRISGRQLISEHQPLAELILYAYDIKAYQLSGGPSWVYSRDLYGSDVYEVIARSGGESVPTPQQFRLMLQRLLWDRFELRLHRTTKKVPSYALVVSEKGAKLKEGVADPTVPRANWKSGGVAEEIDARDVPLTWLVNVLEVATGKPVVDKTGLKGTYMFQLRYASSDSPADSLAPSIYTAVQEQLGLNLKALDESFDMLAIDSVQRPSEN
jgi:uncharacterized protein (TIGR03435 family)